MKRRLLLTVLFIISIMITACGKSGNTEAATEADNEVRYKVDYCGDKDSYFGAKNSYKPGEKVTLVYSLIATDTDYSFYLDGESLNYQYDDTKGFLITFIMPDHDVKLELKTENTMMAIENTTEDTTEDTTEGKTEDKTEDKTEAGGNDAAALSSSSGCPLKVVYYDDVSIDETGMEYWTLFNDTYSTRVVMTTDSGLVNFRIVALMMQDVDASGNATFVYDVIEQDPYLDEDRKLLVTLSFYGDTPNIGIAYKDPKTAEEQVFALYQSGKDGSLCLENITGYASERVSYDVADVLNKYSEVLMNYKDTPEGDRMEYLVVDINDDGVFEMLIYLDGKLKEVIGYNGSQSVVSLGYLSDSDVTLYDDCMACKRGEVDDGWFCEIYYRFNPNVALYLPVVETRYELDENGDAVNQEYYIYSVEGDWEEFEKEYAQFDIYPTWAGEWGDTLTADEYNAKISKGGLFQTSVTAAVSDFNGF